jgi:hypothetical protein
MREQELADRGPCAGVLEEKAVPALEDLQTRSRDRLGERREFSSGARSSKRPAATSVAASTAPRRSQVSWWRRASSWRAKPPVGSAPVSGVSSSAISARSAGSLSVRRSISSTIRCERCGVGSHSSSCSGAEAPPAPPLEVQASTSACTRAPARIATSCATMPPKEMPTIEKLSQPAWSHNASASAAKSAIVGCASGSSASDRPRPRWSKAIWSKRAASGHVNGPGGRRRSLPVPDRNSSGSPLPARSYWIRAPGTWTLAIAA